MNALFFVPFALVGVGAGCVFFPLVFIAVLRGGLERSMLGLLLFSGTFTLAFGGVGIGGLVGTLRLAARARRESRLRESHPDAPWMWRERWLGGALRSRPAYAAWAGLFGATLFNFVVWTLAVFPAPEAPLPPWTTPLLWTGKVVGLLLLAAALRLAVGAWRARGARLELESTPVRRGAVLHARLELPASLAARVRRVRLRCERRDISQQGTHERISHVTLFEQVTDVAPGTAHAGRGVDLSLDVPADAPDCDDTHAWLLSVEAEGRLGGAIAAFELPVFGRG